MKRPTGRGQLLVLLSLGMGLLLTVVVTWGYLQICERMDRIRFERDADVAQLVLSNRVERAVALLRGAAGLLSVMDRVTPAEFRQFAARLGLPEFYPGLAGIGYCRRVPAAEKEKFLADMRAQGRPNFEVRPAGERAEYQAVAYLEPEDRHNQSMLGYDMSAEPASRAAMERACDRGGVAASGRVLLLQEIDQEPQPCFFIYSPIYHGGQIPPDVAARRTALAGFTYIPFRAGNFFPTVFADTAYPAIFLEIFDGTDISPEGLLYAAKNAQEAAVPTVSPRFAVTRFLEVAGRPWTLRFTSRPEFDRASGAWFAPFLLSVGGLASLLLAGIAWAESGARAAAERNADLFRQERERFRTTLSSIGDAVVVTDEAGRVTFMNSIAERLTGWPQAEAMQRPSAGIVRLVQETSRQAVENPVAGVLREKRVVVGPAAPVVLIARDGTERPIDYSGAPVRDARGDAAGSVLIFHDISERRQAQEALQIERERMDIVLEAAAVGLWYSNPPFDRLILDKRACEHLHLTEEADLTVDAFCQRLHPEDRQRTRQAMARAIQERQKYDIEYRTVSSDDAITWVRAIGRTFYNEAGRPVRFAGVTIDTTNRKRQEVERERLLASERIARAEAERANATKDEFLATLSHELRTPLNSILGWTQLLRRSPALAEDVRQGLENIENSGRMQARLVEDLLDMSRIIAGKLRLNVRRVALSEVIEAALESLRPAMEAKAIQLRKLLAMGGVINGDAQRLQQIVWNLLSNAIKFTPRGGQVEALLERADTQVEIRISDTGQGVKKEFLSYIFDRFRQADSSTTRKHGGLGLGLAIVKHLTELHGGTVRAQSEGEGQGATFIVTLPLAPVCETRAADLPPSAPILALSPGRERPSLAGVKVLVVDDDPDACAILRRLLEESQAEVAIALSAAEALRMFESVRPHILVSDIGMPEQDGYELVRKIRALPSASGGLTPAVALTAFARAEDRIRALEAGYQTHVSKPVEPIEFLTVIDSLATRAALG